jgi:hypothetical protein
VTKELLRVPLSHVRVEEVLISQQRIGGLRLRRQTHMAK